MNQVVNDLMLKASNDMMRDLEQTASLAGMVDGEDGRLTVVAGAFATVSACLLSEFYSSAGKTVEEVKREVPGAADMALIGILWVLYAGGGPAESIVKLMGPLKAQTAPLLAQLAKAGVRIPGVKA